MLCRLNGLNWLLLHQSSLCFFVVCIPVNKIHCKEIPLPASQFSQIFRKCDKTISLWQLEWKRKFPFVSTCFKSHRKDQMMIKSCVHQLLKITSRLWLSFPIPVVMEKTRLSPKLTPKWAVGEIAPPLVEAGVTHPVHLSYDLLWSIKISYKNDKVLFPRLWRSTLPTQGGLRRVLWLRGQECPLVFPIMHPSKNHMRARLTIDAVTLTVVSPRCSSKILKPWVVHYFLKTKHCAIKFRNHRNTPHNTAWHLNPPKIPQQ